MGIRMKRRINIQLMAIAGIAIAATLLLVTAVYYEVFQRQVFEDLKTYTRLLGRMEQAQAPIEPDDWEWLPEGGQEQLRITVIDKSGEVLYDTNAEASQLDNHGGRAEVMEAFEKGEGTIVRTSSTFNKSTFYFALRLDENTVLRAAKEADSILSIFLGVLPMVLSLAAVLFVICMLLAHFLTQRLVAPINRIAGQLDSAQEVDTYKELQPFVKTIRKQHEDILQSARLRQDFTANVSHELKTPLTSISGYAELIESGMAGEEDTMRFAGEIHRNSKRLLTLINDIIRLSELDVLKDDTVYERLNLSEIARTCVDMLQVNAEKHGVSLQFEGEACFVTANRDMMEELLYNLTDNAIRYNNRGGRVSVTVRDAENEVCLSVKDTGIGISKEHQERIFERFYRVDKSRSKSTGGTGLGLAIVKHIVSKHNARMELESEPGQGTDIRVYFKKPGTEETAE